jgi:hypothetical protein
VIQEAVLDTGISIHLFSSLSATWWQNEAVSLGIRYLILSGICR